MNWQKISQSLEQTYKNQNLLPHYNNDESYLRKAFEFTESLWQRQLNQIDKLEVIMISEAPLFGKNQKYIYNKNSPPSSFFYYQDIEALPTVKNLPEKPTSIIEQKTIMLKEFVNNGLLILDIFPFAFNEKDTSLNYRKMSNKIYTQLLEQTKDCYLIPKLKLCLNKVNKNTHFIYRYKKLFDKTGNHFEKVLTSVISNSTVYNIDSINGTNMSLDRKKLETLLSTRTSNKSFQPTANAASEFKC